MTRLCIGRFFLNSKTISNQRNFLEHEKRVHQDDTLPIDSDLDPRVEGKNQFGATGRI